MIPTTYLLCGFDSLMLESRKYFPRNERALYPKKEAGVKPRLQRASALSPPEIVADPPGSLAERRVVG